MKRVAVGVAMLLLTGAAPPPAPAPAGCDEQIRAARAKLAEIKDPARHEELQKLVEKAEHDRDAGRAEACGKTMQHAQQLM